MNVLEAVLQVNESLTEALFLAQFGANGAEMWELYEKYYDCDILQMYANTPVGKNKFANYVDERVRTMAEIN